MDVLVDEESIVRVLRDEVIKRDSLEGPNAESAARLVNRTEAAQKAAKTVAKKQDLAEADAPQKESVAAAG